MQVQDGRLQPQKTCTCGMDLMGLTSTVEEAALIWAHNTVLVPGIHIPCIDYICVLWCAHFRHGIPFMIQSGESATGDRNKVQSFL